jgi:hypothetical protein
MRSPDRRAAAISDPVSRRSAVASRHLVTTWPRRTRSAIAGGITGIVIAVVIAGRALAESPVPSSAVSGDPRSSGQGPGLVGDPAGAIAAVLLVAAVALVLTLLYVRATGGPGQPSGR